MFQLNSYLHDPKNLIKTKFRMKKFYLALGVLVGMASAVTAQDLVKLQTGTPKLSADQIANPLNHMNTSIGGKKATNFLKAGAPADTLLEEPFANDGLPVALTNANGNTGFGWEVDTINIDYGWNPSATNATSFFSCNDAKYDDAGNSNSAMDTALTEAFDFTEGNNIGLVVDVFFSDNGTSSAEIIYSVDGGAWGTLHTVVADTGWQNLVLITPEVINTSIQFGFVYNDNGSTDAGFAIDNVFIKEAIADLTSFGDIANRYAISNLNQVEELTFNAELVNNELKGVTVDGTGALEQGGTPLVVLTSNGTALAYNEDSVIALGASASITPSELGVYTGVFETTSTPADDISEDNFNEFAYTLTDSVLGLDNGIIDEGNPNAIGIGLFDLFGIGAFGAQYLSDNELVNIFTFNTGDTLRGVYVETTGNSTVGATFVAEVYLVTPEGTADIDGGALFETVEGTRNAAAGETEVHFLKFVGGNIEVTAGDEFAILLKSTADFQEPIFINQSTRVNINGGSNSNYKLGQGLVDFGLPERLPAANLQYPVIRLITGSVEAAAGYDLALGEFESNLDGYGQIPLTQASSFKVDGVVYNKETGDATAATATLEVSTDGSVVSTETVTLGDIAASDSAIIDFAAFAFPDTGLYDLIITTSYDEVDQEASPANNGATFQVYISDTTYSRIIAPAGLATLPMGEQTLGGATGEIVIASVFDITAADTISEIIVATNSYFAGMSIDIVVYEWAGAAPDYTAPLISQSYEFTEDDADPGTINLTAVRLNDFILGEGQYLIGFKGTTATDTLDAVLASDPNALPMTGLVLVGNEGAFDLAVAFGTTYMAYGEIYLGAQTVTSVGEKELPNVSVFPNPSNGVVTVLNAAGTDYSLVDIAGKTVATGSVSSNQEQIKFNNVTTGTYILKLSSEEGVKVSKLSIK